MDQNNHVEQQQQSETSRLQTLNVQDCNEVKSEEQKLIKDVIMDRQESKDNDGKDNDDMNRQFIKKYETMVQQMVETDEYKRKQQMIEEIDQQLMDQLNIKMDSEEYIQDDTIDILDQEKYLDHIESYSIKLKQYLIVQMSNLYINKNEKFKQELMMILNQNGSLICHLLILFLFRKKNIELQIVLQYRAMFQKMYQIVPDKKVQLLYDIYGFDRMVLEFTEHKTREAIAKGLCKFILQTGICETSNLIFRNVGIKYLVTIIMSDSGMLTLENIKFQNQICKFLEKDSSDEEFEYSSLIESNMNQIRDKFEAQQNQVYGYVDYLISRQYQYILSFMLKTQRKGFMLGPKQIIKLIKQSQLHFVQEYIQHDPQAFYYLLSQPSTKIFELLMKDGQSNNHFLFQLQILFQMVSEYKELFQENIFIMVLKKYSHLINNKNKIDDTFFNNLYIYCLIGLTLRKLCGKWQRYNYYFDDLSQQYLQHSEELVRNLNDDSAFQLTLFQKHNQFQFTLVELLFQDKTFFQSIINLPQFQRVVDQIWSGNTKTNPNPFSYLFSYQFYYEEQSIKQVRQPTSIQQSRQSVKRMSRNQSGSSNNVNSIKQYNWFDKISNKLLSEQSIFKYLKTIPQEKQYYFQFEVYLKNLSVRKLFDTVIFIVIFIDIMMSFQDIVKDLYLINPVWDSSHIQMFVPEVPSQYAQNITMDATKATDYVTYKNQLLQSSQYRQNFQQICDRLVNQVFTFKADKQKQEFSQFCYGIKHYNSFVQKHLLYFSIMMVLLITNGFNWILKLFYQYLVHRKVYVTMDCLGDTLIMIACSIQVYWNYQLYNQIQPSDYYIQYYRSLTINLSIISLLAFFKLVSQLSIIKTFGIYVKAINQIFSRLALFLLYYMILVVLATLVFYNLFHGIEGSGYDDLTNTFLSVFSQPLGNFNIIATDGLTGYKLWLVNCQNIVGLAYAFFMSTFLLNIIIAILSNVYEEIDDNSQQQYSEILYIDYLQNTPNIYYDCCENIPFALRIISIIIYPFLIIKKNKSLNRKINYVIYMLKFLIPFYVLSIVYNLYMIPFIYFRFIKMILQNKYCNEDYFLIDIDQRTQLRHLVEFICLGPFYLFFRFFTTDTLFIFENMNNPNIQYFQYLFDRDVYVAFKHTTFECINQKQMYISHSEFCQKLYQNLIKFKDDSHLCDSFVSTIRNRLQILASQQENGLISTQQMAQVINQIKNKSQNIDENTRIENKTKALEIFFARYIINEAQHQE